MPEIQPRPAPDFEHTAVRTQMQRVRRPVATVKEHPARFVVHVGVEAIEALNRDVGQNKHPSFTLTPALCGVSCDAPRRSTRGCRL